MSKLQKNSIDIRDKMCDIEASISSMKENMSKRSENRAVEKQVRVN